eukprot:TRINITY_DN16789_c4_g1_i1.p1 TRINITY_DN16789_c4_g1~~TRINITY_DN16789_c4_g1_i1.p1  ORF type:complete len:589 (+),score=130.07 TRINITY_DN16789_c4_g1_i1:51-1817(+)
MTRGNNSMEGSIGQPNGITLVEPNSLNLGAVDWQALEMKFCELNALRNAPRTGLDTSCERRQQSEEVGDAIESLLEMAQSACRRLLVEGDSKEAIQGGLKTLKLKESYYGTGSLQLVPSYFHLARTNQYMDRFKAAEEFLSLAQWTMLRHPTCDLALKSELHQTYGLLYASDGRLDTALKQLAQAAYYLSELHGPEHIQTSFGYFDLGNVFAAKSNMDCAMSFYDKVKDIWYRHLTDSFQHKPFGTLPKPPELLSPEQLGEEDLQDALKMMRGIVGLQTERFTQVHPVTGKAELVLGLFNVWIADNVQAQECLGRALEIHKRVYGTQHPTVVAIKGYILQFKFPLPEHTQHFLHPKRTTEPTEDEQHDAATRIQKIQRGRMARQQVQHRREREATEHIASMKIQSLQRGNMGRKRADRIKEGSEEPLGKVQTQQPSPEEDSPPTSPLESEQEAAATKIQALQRGRVARKNNPLPEASDKAPDVDKNTDENDKPANEGTDQPADGDNQPPQEEDTKDEDTKPEGVSKTESEEQELAATKIQALQRGRMARKAGATSDKSPQETPDAAVPEAEAEAGAGAEAEVEATPES